MTWHWQLQRLDAAVGALKRFAGRIASTLVMPIPFMGYRTIEVLRDLVYLAPHGLDESAVNELLAVLHEGVFGRSGTDSIRRWLLGDTRADKVLIERLTAAESALAKSIAASERSSWAWTEGVDVNRSRPGPDVSQPVR